MNTKNFKIETDKEKQKIYKKYIFQEMGKLYKSKRINQKKLSNYMQLLYLVNDFYLINPKLTEEI